jgi:antitoxin VapB
MRLFIKDREAIRLARQLAMETGETITRAVTEALRERLQRALKSKRGMPCAESLLKYGHRCRNQLKGPIPDHTTLLYGDDGLPH